MIPAVTLGSLRVTRSWRPRSRAIESCCQARGEKTRISLALKSVAVAVSVFVYALDGQASLIGWVMLIFQILRAMASSY
jgi:hypothetical protein